MISRYWSTTLYFRILVFIVLDLYVVSSYMILAGVYPSYFLIY